MAEFENEVRDRAAESLKRTKDNNLAYAAANRWISTQTDHRMAAYQGGYSGELFKWLVAKYFKKACDSLIAGRFEVGKGYVLDRFENIDVPGWLIDSWLEREAEKNDCRKALNKRAGSGFRQIGGLLK